MNKIKAGGMPSNTHVLMMQVVDAANPSRTFGSPVPVRPEDTAQYAGIGEGKAVLITQGPQLPPPMPSSLGRVGKQKPGTQHAGVLAKHLSDFNDLIDKGVGVAANGGLGNKASMAKPSSKTKKKR